VVLLEDGLARDLRALADIIDISIHVCVLIGPTRRISDDAPPGRRQHALGGCGQESGEKA
jgi:hypothetical protein